MLNPPRILNSTAPILYETGYEDAPYAYAGSCYPVRWKNNLYIVSAFHCYKNHQIDPERTLYPIPNNPGEFYGFCCKFRAKLNGAKDLKHFDQILLMVSRDIHSGEILNSVMAVDLSDPGSFISLMSQEIKEIWLRGFLFDNPMHAIDYQDHKIRQQAYVTNGNFSFRKSLFDFCHLVKIRTPLPNNMSPNGMSGSAVYATDRHGNTKLAGTVIEYNSFTDEFVVIDSIVLKEALQAENA